MWSGILRVFCITVVPRFDGRGIRMGVLNPESGPPEDPCFCIGSFIDFLVCSEESGWGFNVPYIMGKSINKANIIVFGKTVLHVQCCSKRCTRLVVSAGVCQEGLGFIITISYNA